MVIFPIAAGYVTPSDHVTAMVMMTLGISINGFSETGYLVNHLDIAPAFASVLLGVTNTAATMSGIISPTLTGHIVQHHVREHNILKLRQLGNGVLMNQRISELQFFSFSVITSFNRTLLALGTPR